MLQTNRKKSKYGTVSSYKTLIYDHVPVQENPKVFPAVMTKISFDDNKKIKIIVSTVRIIKDDKTTYYKYSKSGQLKDSYVSTQILSESECHEEYFVNNFNKIIVEGIINKEINLLEFSKNMYLQEKNKYAEKVHH